MKISVIGGGAWGLALSNVLFENGQKVLIFEKNPAKVHYFLKNHMVETFKNHVFPTDLKMTSNSDEIFEDPDVILIATPCAGLKDTAELINSKLKNDVKIINAAKGFEPSSVSFVLDFLKEKFKNNKHVLSIGSILGPGFAAEVLEHNFTCVCGVSSDLKMAEFIQEIFSNNYFRVYSLTDEVGAQIGTSLKNAMAIGSGIIRGLGFGENTKAALITRGLAEIKRFGDGFNAMESTFLGLTGIGDLVLTCNGDESRNFKAGYQIGKDDSAKNFLETNTMTVEGISTIEVTYKLAKQKGIDMPIIEALYRTIFDSEKPSKVVSSMFTRPLKSEK